MLATYTKTGVHSEEFTDKVVKVFQFDGTNGTLGAEIASFATPNVATVAFSPRDTYLAIQSRKSVHTEGIPLFRVYNVRTGDMVDHFDYAENQDFVWGWSGDESVFGSTYSEGVRFREGGIEKRLELPQIKTASLVAAGGKLRVWVVFGRDPVKMKVYEYPNLERQLGYRPIMVGEQFALKPSPNGRAAVCIATKQHAADSYYGESFAFYLNDQGRQGLALKKKGPIHTVEWSPTGSHLVTVAGAIPPQVSLWLDVQGSAYEIGEFDVNSAQFSATGLVAVGGFSGMGGDFFTFDIQRREVVGRGNAKFSSSWSWSPCGRLLLTAVLFQKLTVQNEVCIFNHVGDRVWRAESIVELVQAEWLGQPGALPLPDLPRKAKAEAQPKAAVYVPPHLRRK